MTSTRLPGKVLLPLDGEPLVLRVLQRVSAIEGIDGVVLAVPDGPEHDPLLAAAERAGCDLVRGPEDDVLARTLLAAESRDARTVLRVTSDCPMVDPAVSSAVLAAYRVAPVAYARTAVVRGFPHGFDTEVVAVEALRQAVAGQPDDYEREHVTPFVWRRPERFPTVEIDFLPDRRAWRVTVDTPEDYHLAREIYRELGGDPPFFGLSELTTLFARRPELLRLNAAVATTPYLGRPEG